MNRRKQFVALARVSSREQEREGFSLDVQVDALKRFAQNAHGKVMKLFRIAETASRSEERKTFKEMIAFAKEHAHKLDGILFYKLDRGVRNLFDYVELERLESEYDLPFISISQPTEGTPAGRMMRRTLANMASFFTEQQSVDVREGLARRVQAGWFVGTAPYGYRNLRIDGRAIVEPDPQTANNVRRMFHLFAGGTFTLDSLVAQLHADGLTFKPYRPKFPRTSVHQILQNPAYSGLIPYKGQLFEGKYEPLVTKTVFDQVQEVCKRKSKPHTIGLKPYVYRGMFRCGECGCFITTETQKGHNYLHCTKRVKRDCSQPFVREEVVSNQIVDTLRSVALPADDADWMVGQLEVRRDRDETAGSAVRTRLRTSLSDIQRKLERLADLYSEEGLERDEYARFRNKHMGEKQRIKEQLAALEANPSNRFEPIIRFVSDSKKAGFLATSGSPEEKRDHFKKTGSNLQLLNRELRWEPRGAWQIVHETLADQGCFAHKHTAAPFTGAAVCRGESSLSCFHPIESGRQDLNLRPLGPEPSALPS
jgi:site-specific DNA recombinase